jgi:hypothetical protein
VLLSAVPALVALAAGYQGMQAVFACLSKAGVERGCLLGGYFWLLAAALFLVLWVVAEAALAGRRRSGEGEGPRG